MKHLYLKHWGNQNSDKSASSNSYFYNYKPSPRMLPQHRVLRNRRKNKDIIITKPVCLPKFDIYQGRGTTNCLKSHTKFWCPDSFRKKFCLISCLKFILSDVTSFLLDNLAGLKNMYIKPVNYKNCCW